MHASPWNCEQGHGTPQQPRLPLFTVGAQVFSEAAAGLHGTKQETEREYRSMRLDCPSRLAPRKDFRLSAPTSRRNSSAAG